MNEFLDNASSFITGKPVSECEAEELERLTNEHPYFSIGHVLLAKKYKSQDHSGFIPHVQKAAIFFNNPYWLHYQLLNAKPEFIAIENAESKEESITLLPTHDISQIESDAVEVNEEDVRPEPVFKQDELPAAEFLPNESLSPLPVVPEVEETETDITPDEMHPEREEVLEEIQEQTETEKNDADNLQDEELLKDEVAPSDNTLDDIHSAEQTQQTEEPVAEKDLIETVVESSLVEPVLIDELPDTIETKETNESDAEETDSETTVLHTESVPEKQAQPSATPPVSNEPLIPIEPYYTVDYFASQGIKLTLDKNPQDKLGKQLRSFTDWLKHMKKLGPEDALKATTETQVDPVIKNIADTSNKPEEIVTEAMADVLVKQGKTDQAIEVYNKLSFLNPDKSAYFADQIQKLKGT